jgi:hypothetical protein
LDYEREIEFLKAAMEELKRERRNSGDESPREKTIDFMQWENNSSRNYNFSNSSEKQMEKENTIAPQSPLRFRSPSSSVAQSMKEINGIFIGGPTVNSSHSKEDKAIDETVNFISEDIRNLFAPPQNLDESDYTLLRVFNPVKYPQPKKKLPLARLEELQINKLKLELSMHKHKHRIENNKNKGRMISKTQQQQQQQFVENEISPRQNFRRGNQSYHDNQSSHHGFAEPPIIARSHQSNQVDALDPVLDHFAPSAPTSPRQKNMNQIIVVKPSPYNNVYEETVFMVESRPSSRLAPDATVQPQSQDQRPQTRVADLTLDEFQQITDK